MQLTSVVLQIQVAIRKFGPFICGQLASPDTVDQMAKKSKKKGHPEREDFLCKYFYEFHQNSVKH
jgi:hypothetical protein